MLVALGDQDRVRGTHGRELDRRGRSEIAVVVVVEHDAIVVGRVADDHRDESEAGRDVRRTRAVVVRRDRRGVADVLEGAVARDRERRDALAGRVGRDEASGLGRGQPAVRRLERGEGVHHGGVHGVDDHVHVAVGDGPDDVVTRHGHAERGLACREVDVGRVVVRELAVLVGREGLDDAGARVGQVGAALRDDDLAAVVEALGAARDGEVLGVAGRLVDAGVVRHVARDRIGAGDVEAGGVPGGAHRVLAHGEELLLLHAVLGPVDGEEHDAAAAVVHGRVDARVVGRDAAAVALQAALALEVEDLHERGDLTGRLVGGVDQQVVGVVLVRHVEGEAVDDELRGRGHVHGALRTGLAGQAHGALGAGQAVLAVAAVHPGGTGLAGAGGGEEERGEEQEAVRRHVVQVRSPRAGQKQVDGTFQSYRTRTRPGPYFSFHVGFQ